LTITGSFLFRKNQLTLLLSAEIILTGNLKITTGFGSLHKKTISKDQLNKLQENLVMSHACGTGPVVREEIVRLMLILKIHALSLGKSGVQVSTVQRLIDFFNEGVTPVVFEQGSLGASGDLAPLAHLVLPLLGMGEVFFKGKVFASSEILEKFGWSAIELKSKEGLALLNGTQFMSAHGVYILWLAERLSQFADITSAISLEAYDGRPDPFFENIHAIRPHKDNLKKQASYSGSVFISLHSTGSWCQQGCDKLCEVCYNY
jgi:histidine ammonia-lyase